MMLVRTANPADCATLARLQVNSYRSAYAKLLPAEYLAYFTYEEQEQDWQDLIETGEQLLLVVEEQGQVIGYALSRAVKGEDLPFDCELIALHVDRDHHWAGNGRALMVETARCMHAVGCQSMGLWVMDGNPASDFYEHLGGQRQGEQWIDLDGLNFQFKEIGYVWPRIEDLLNLSG